MAKLKKKKRESRLVRGDDILAGRGIDLDAEDTALLPRLLEAIGSDPDADLSIADWLGSIALPEAARRLQEWDLSDPADKDLKRVIRGSLFRLEQRGTGLVARELRAREPVRLVDPVEPSGWLSPLDGVGNRRAWLSRPRVEGGLTVLLSVISDRNGMRLLDARAFTRSRFRELLSEVGRQEAAMVEVPHRYVDRLMHEAYRQGAPRDESGGGYPLLRAEIYATPPEPVESPVHEMLGSMSAADETRLMMGSGGLFEEPEMIHWLLPEEMAGPHRARMREALDSTLVLSGQQTKERLAGIVSEALEELQEDRTRALYAGRMREMALWYHLAERAEPARTCYALHRALADPDRPLADIPFLRELADRSFRDLIPVEDDQDRGREPRDPSSLIVRPD